MLVQNIKNTSDRLPPDEYDSWIAFWEDKTGEEAPSLTVGGHVIKADSTDEAWYIAAITKAQNNSTIPYEYHGELAKLHD